MSAGAPALTTIGTADRNLDVPVAVRQRVTQAESRALIERLLGLSVQTLGQETNDRVRDRITQAIFSRVQETRSSISRQQFANVLEGKLTAAMIEIEPDARRLALNDPRRISAIAQAVYETLPADVLDEMIVDGLPQTMWVSRAPTPSQLRTRPIEINSVPTILEFNRLHPFWSVNINLPDDQLQAQIAGHNAPSIGVACVPPMVPFGRHFNAEEARAMIDEVRFYQSFERQFQANSTQFPGVALFGAPAGDLRVNFNHPFWSNQTFSSPAELASRLLNQTTDAVGIAGRFPVNSRITAPEATVIAGLSTNVVRKPNLNPESGDINFVTSTMPAGKAKLRARDFCSGRTTNDAPTGLQNRDICTLNFGEIESLLQYRNPRGQYPYWTMALVNSAGILPDDLDTSVTPNIQLHRKMAEALYRLIEPTAPYSAGRVLGQIGGSMLSLASEVTAGKVEMKERLDTLRNGSENTIGASMAAALVAEDPTLYTAVTDSTDQAKLKTEISEAKAKIELGKLLGGLRDLTLHFDMHKLTDGVTDVTFDGLIDQRSKAQSDLLKIGAATPPAAWDSNFANHAGVFGAPNTLTTTSMQNDAKNKITQHVKELNAEISKYQQIVLHLTKLQSAANKAKATGSARLTALLTPAGVPPAPQYTIDSKFEPVKDVDTIIGELKLDGEDTLKKAVETKEAALKKAEAGGDTGDVLQHKIFQEYYRRQGMDLPSAQAAANYTYSRSILDQGLSDEVDALLEDLYDGDHDKPKVVKRSKEMIKSLASTLGLQRRTETTPVRSTFVPLGIGGGGYFVRTGGDRREISEDEWQTLPYQKLVLAYFSLKKMYEGKAPDQVNCASSATIKAEMKKVAKILARRHVSSLMNDFGNTLSDEDREKLGSKKSLSVETLEKFLVGDAPPRYAERIDHYLVHMAEDVRDRSERSALHRKVGWSAGTAAGLAGAGVATGLLTGATALGTVTGTLPLVAAGAALVASPQARAMVKKGMRAFAGGTVSTGGALKNGVVGTVGWTWGQRKNIATLGLFTLIGGPLGVAAWGAMKAMSSDGGSTPASGGH